MDNKKVKKAVCKLCDGLTLAYAGVTSNLLNHLEAKYPIDYEKTGSGESCVIKKQFTLSSFHAEFVYRDLHPISTVDGKRFRQLMSFVEPGYKPPSCPHLTTTSRRLYTSLKEELLGVFTSPYVAVTTDMWTSRATQGYLTVTAHFINSKWEFESKVLLTQEMAETHTRECIAERLWEAVEEWEIDESRASSIGHDNASNMRVAVEKRCWEDVPYFAHTLRQEAS